MLKLTIFGIEHIVTVGMPVRIQNILTEEIFTAHVGLIRGEFVALFDDVSIILFTASSNTDESELFRLANGAKLECFHEV